MIMTLLFVLIATNLLPFVTFFQAVSAKVFFCHLSVDSLVIYLFFIVSLSFVFVQLFFNVVFFLLHQDITDSSLLFSFVG